MTIHLITVVGAEVSVLPFMLDHYRQQRVTSFVINVHLASPDDPTHALVQRITDGFGCPPASLTVGKWQSVMQGLWHRSMQARPDDWCVLADQDELHGYPDHLPSLLAYCDRKGYDHILGGFVDRLSGDGGFPAVDSDRPIADQFPLGGFVSFPMLGADPRKVVAAKGRVCVGRGQHEACGGTPCPPADLFVPVHHYKWTAGLVNRLQRRANELRGQGLDHWIQSDRFVQYFAAQGGRIDLSDERFLVAPCRPGYPHWPRLTAMAIAHGGASAAPLVVPVEAS